MFKIRLTGDTIDKEDIDAVCKWLQTQPQLTKGQETEEFEKEWAQYFNRKYAVFVNSGSSANLLMYAAAKEWGKQQGYNWTNRAVVQAMGWATTLSPAIQLGYDVSLCDVNSIDWTIDTWQLRAILEKRRADVVTIVHTLGIPCCMANLMRVKEDYPFMLLEDCCSSYGSTTDGAKVGTFGDMSSFSLYYAHVLSSIEGGIVCTDREDLYELLLMLRSHGWARDIDENREEQLAKDWDRTGLNRMFTFYVPGYNVRSTDLQAFIGRRQLKKFDRFIRDRDFIHKEYIRQANDDLTGITGVSSQYYNEEDTICSISLGIQFDSSTIRDKVAQALFSAGVEIRPIGGGSLGRQPFWIKYNGTPTELPVADELHDTTLLVPNHPFMTSSDVSYIIKVIRDTL